MDYGLRTMGRLFWKIFLGFWLTLVLMGAGVGFLVHYYNQQRLAALSDLVAGPWAAGNVASVASTLRYGGADAVMALFRQWPGRRPNPVLVVDSQGQDILHRPVPEETLQRARALLASGAAHPGVAGITAPDGQRYVLFVPKDVFQTLMMHRMHVRMSRMLGGHRHPGSPPLLIWLATGLLASLLFSLVLAWYLTRPLRHLRAATRSLAAGALDTRVMPHMGWRRDEITELGRDFDHMAARLQAVIGAQRRLLHDVSHELRSPLARMQVAVALAHQQPGKRAQALARIERDTARLDELVAQLLSLSRLEAGVEAAPGEYVDVTALLAMLTEDARFEAIGRNAQARNVQLVLRCARSVVVQGRGELLRQAFENVIRNALNYTAVDTTVTVECAVSDDRLVVTVCDEGAGVEEAELESIFEPFVRTVRRAHEGGAEGRRGGYGLGLAIARRAIEAHGGSVKAMNRPGGGLCVSLHLPIIHIDADADIEGASDAGVEPGDATRAGGAGRAASPTGETHPK